MNIYKYLEMTEEELLSLPTEVKITLIKELLELMNKQIKKDNYSSSYQISIDKFINYFTKSINLKSSDSETKESKKYFLLIIKIAKEYLNDKLYKSKNTINKYLSLSEKEFLNLSNEEIIIFINDNYKTIKDRLSTSHNKEQYQELINDIKLFLQTNKKHTKKRNQYLLVLFRILKEVLTPTEEEIIDIFLDYVSANNITKLDNILLFSNIDNLYFKDNIIIIWYLKQYLKDPKKLKQYAIATNGQNSKIFKIIKKLDGKMIKSINSIQPKLELFLSYAENNEININNNKYFSTIGYKGNKDTKIYDWYKNHTSNNPYILLELAKKYKDKYPNGYKKLEDYLNIKINRNLKHIDNNIRLEVCLKYLNQCSKINKTSKVTFSSIDPLIENDSLILHWLYRLDVNQLESLLMNNSDLSKKYPNGYRLLKENLTNRQTISNKVNLSYDEKLDLYLSYISENEIPDYQNKIRFCDIVPSSVSTTLYNWSLDKVFKEDKIEYIIYKYKDKYPNEIIKILDKYKKLVKERVELNNRISKNKKIKEFMKYIENNNIPSGDSEIRFCDIANNKDQTLVGGWFRDRMRKEMVEFLNSCKKYKNKYPKAYEKVYVHINNSAKKRKVLEKYLLNALKKVLENKEKSYTKKKKVL